MVVHVSIQRKKYATEAAHSEERGRKTLILSGIHEMHLDQQRMFPSLNQTQSLLFLYGLPPPPNASDEDCDFKSLNDKARKVIVLFSN